MCIRDRFDPHCNQFGYGAEGADDEWRQRVGCKHPHDSEDTILEDERITGKGDHALPSGPLLIADPGIPDDRVGDVRQPLLGDAANLELTHWNPAMTAVEMGVDSRAGLQLQHLLGVVQRPDPCEGRTKIVHNRLGASAPVSYTHLRAHETP